MEKRRLLRSRRGLPRRLWWRRARWKALGDEINAFWILHFDPPIWHQIVRTPLRIGSHPMDKPRAPQITHAGRQANSLYAVLFDHLFHPRHDFIPVLARQLRDAVLPEL